MLQHTKVKQTIERVLGKVSMTIWSSATPVQNQSYDSEIYYSGAQNEGKPKPLKSLKTNNPDKPLTPTCF